MRSIVRFPLINPFLVNDDFRLQGAVAAGAVDGIIGYPSGSRLTVVDSGGKFSVTGGKVFMNGGSGIWFDPVGSLPQQKRIAGMGYFFEATPGDTNGLSAVGLGSGILNSSAGDFVMHLASRVISIIQNAAVTASGIEVGAYTAARHVYCLLHRATGYELYVKGGNYTHWTLLWTSDAGTFDPFPILGGRSATVYHEFVRAAFVGIRPVLLSDGFVRANGALIGSVSDGLATLEGPVAGGSNVTWAGSATWTISGNKAVNTPGLGNELVTGGDMSSTTPWTKGTGWAIGSGVATKTAGTASSLYQIIASLAGKWLQISFDIARYVAGNVYPLTSGGTPSVGRSALGTSYIYTILAGAINQACGVYADAAFAGDIDNISLKQITAANLIAACKFGTPNVVVEMPITRLLGAQVGIALCVDDPTNPQNGIVVCPDGNGNLITYKILAGTWSILGTAAMTYAAGTKLKSRISGGVVSSWYNDAKIGNDYTVTDVGVISNLYHGVFSTNPANTVNGIVVKALGVEGQHDASFSVFAQ